MERQRGTVKWINAKGYGFISRPGESDIFFHMKDVQGQKPEEGFTVEYSIGQNKKGPVAIDILVVERS